MVLCTWVFRCSSWFIRRNSSRLYINFLIIYFKHCAAHLINFWKHVKYALPLFPDQYFSFYIVTYCNFYLNSFFLGGVGILNRCVILQNESFPECVRCTQDIKNCDRCEIFCRQTKCKSTCSYFGDSALMFADRPLFTTNTVTVVVWCFLNIFNSFLP